MAHVSESELVSHYYGDDSATGELDAHLRECDACARSFRELAADLDRIITPPVPDPGSAYWAQLRARGWKVRPAGSPFAEDRPRAVLLIWLLPLLYPLTPPAMFMGGQLAHTYGEVGVAVLILTLGWAMAGPAAALGVLDRLQGSAIDTAWKRLAIYGAVAATVSPALFNLTSRTGMWYLAWYAALALIGAASIVPVRALRSGVASTRRLHRTSALIIVAFALVHLSNHLFALVNVPMHAMVLDVVRSVYRRPLVETVLFGAILFQVATGGALVSGVLNRRRSLATNIQALSGLYMVVFFMAHVSAALLARGNTDTNFVWAAGRRGLLASPGLTFLLPYYLLGVIAFFAHAGAYLRQRLVFRIPDVPLKRLSYAAVGFASTVVLAIALALCGIAMAP
jgi:hypothetical protein